MANSIREAKILPNDIDLINCHATSTDVGDVAELNAIKYLFGNKFYNTTENFNNSIDECDYKFQIEESEIDKERLLKLKLDSNKAQIGNYIITSLFLIILYESPIAFKLVAQAKVGEDMGPFNPNLIATLEAIKLISIFNISILLIWL